ncbi:MAG: acyltransferase, partial [Deltaproteobacteria bacterium]
MLLVLTFHIDANLHAPFGPPTSAVPLWLAFVRAGHSGVDLFFVLSSFLLSLPFFTAAAQGRRLNTRGYFARRALRILPLYYSAVAVGTVVCARGPGDLTRGLPYLLFLNALATPLTPWSAVWWSLCTEAQFYLLLPLLSPCLRSRTGRVWGLVALAAYAAVYSAFFAGVFRMPTNYMAAWLGMSLFGRAPQFLA